MLNPGVPVSDDDLKVFGGVDLPKGGINVGAAQVEANVRHALRRQVPQWRTWAPVASEVAVVGGGPSLAQSLGELRDLSFAGIPIVTVNGAYHWCLAHNLKPRAQVVIDAQAHNARFVDPEVPNCRYMIASQCHPSVWDAVESRDEVFMLHAGCADEPIKSLLDAHYGGQWFNVTGGTTVVSRAIYAMRMAGFLRFHLFGVDCCVQDDAHHAYAQAENDTDRLFSVRVEMGEARRVFRCAPWQLKQLYDLMAIIKVDGDLFRMQVHGDGMLAWVVRHGGNPLSVAVDEAPALALTGA